MRWGTQSFFPVYTWISTQQSVGAGSFIYLYSLSDSSESSLEDIKPTVLKESQVTVEKDSSVDLYCLGVGHPATMTYVWTIGDGVALDFSNGIVQSDFGRQVTISKAASADAGLYKCSCSNTEGNTDSYITLKVKESSKKFGILANY